MTSLLMQFREFLLSLPAWASVSIGLAILIVVAVIADRIAKAQLIRILKRISKRTDHTWDDVLVEHKVAARFAQILPALVFYFSLALVPGIPDGVVAVGENVAVAYGVLILSLTGSAFLSAVNAIYERYPVSRERPIKGYLQVGKILIFVLAGVLVVAVLLDRSPVLLLSGFGAMTAVLLLVFRDTILSLVASIQLTSLDMVRVGDWVEMPQCNADGDVIEVSLHTVKIQNWDKTITTIPTHRLITDSFKNWRGMGESGGRRIKRDLRIDINSIRFMTPEEIERCKRFVLLRDYIDSKLAELADYNSSVGQNGDGVNLRRLTNVGTFRAYVLNYLKNHPRIHQEMTLIVRQLQPGPTGLPLEIYAFTNITDWAVYEEIQADIFDHLLAVAEEFGLVMYQEPAGRDMSALASRGR
ncbi:MAG TPA: mechanosensitive ion channel domain-containing protein [Gammaproteobacteria bacterium]